MKWDKVAYKYSTYDITHKKSETQNQIIVFTANYKTCRVF